MLSRFLITWASSIPSTTPKIRPVFVWQAILGGLTEIVRNHSKDRFGTRVPFAGTFDNPKPEILTTVGNAFRNAFVKAFEGKLENKTIELPKKVEPEKKD